MSETQVITRGSNCIITQRIYGHQFEIGEGVTVIRSNALKDCFICVNTENEMWACKQFELEKLTGYPYE